ncbi:MAG: sugar ABC transporter substrate-binding protein [Nocardiopsaceae bacterium]|nr:sugar ABC transporter substrate-binding protein [Nocardiopsaceae bacterium]
MKLTRPRIPVVLTAAVMTLATACASGGNVPKATQDSTTGTITVAVVSNPLITDQMIPLTKQVFEKENPGIHVNFAVYTEGDLRAAIEKDVATHSNEFNIVMISPYEAPLFAKNGWLDNLTTKYIKNDPGYDAKDLLPPVAKALSYKGGLYAAPFYGESSMLYYRKSLLKKAGITMPAHPTWQEVAKDAARLNQPGKVAGICLRGLAGWGDNMASIDTVVNTFGGQWFGPGWKPELTSPAFENAVKFYVNLTRKYGESGASNDSFNQLLTLYGQGQCAMWYDSTVAATSIVGSYPSIARDTGYAYAPTEKTRDSGWLYSWAMGIPSGTPDQAAAWKFASWASSKAYDDLVAKKYGWSAVPPGARTSLYKNPAYQKAAAPFANITLKSLDGVNPDHPTVHPAPYVGIQYVDVPQFETLGLQVGEQIAGAISGSESVSQALQTSQNYASIYTPKQLSGTNGR